VVGLAVAFVAAGCVGDDIDEVDDRLEVSAGGQPGTASLGATTTEYAPYFYAFSWGDSRYPFTSLVDMRAKSGLSSVMLAFVLSEGECRVNTDIQRNLADLNAFRNGGGTVKAAFGGTPGRYLEMMCINDEALASAIVAFVDATGIRDLIFEVDQEVGAIDVVNVRRARALKRVQDSRTVKVSFTLFAVPRGVNGTPGGLSSTSLGVLRAALDAGVTISQVNLLTMYFDPAVVGGRSMSDLAISALEDAATQMQGLIPGLSRARAFAMLGATPMIGVNDIPTQVFSLQDAARLVAFAKSQRLGLLSFWAINRDQPCLRGEQPPWACSGVNVMPFEFHRAFAAVRR